MALSVLFLTWNGKRAEHSSSRARLAAVEASAAVVAAVPEATETAVAVVVVAGAEADTPAVVVGETVLAAVRGKAGTSLTRSKTWKRKR